MTGASRVSAIRPSAVASQIHHAIADSVATFVEGGFERPVARLSSPKPVPKTRRVIRSRPRETATRLIPRVFTAARLAPVRRAPP